jgi:hypothetical protein
MVAGVTVRLYQPVVVAKVVCVPPDPPIRVVPVASQAARLRVLVAGHLDQHRRELLSRTRHSRRAVENTVSNKTS